MKLIWMLNVKWTEDEQATYYVDKDKYSKAHKTANNTIVLLAYEGVYTFDLITKDITLNDGVKIKPVKVVSFKAYETPSIN